MISAIVYDYLLIADLHHLAVFHIALENLKISLLCKHLMHPQNFGRHPRNTAGYTRRSVGITSQ
jgi:hypothetical protein